MLMTDINSEISSQEPSTSIQHPSTNKIPDTTHLLMNTFGYEK